MAPSRAAPPCWHRVLDCVGTASCTWIFIGLVAPVSSLDYCSGAATKPMAQKYLTACPALENCDAIDAETAFAVCTVKCGGVEVVADNSCVSTPPQAKATKVTPAAVASAAGGYCDAADYMPLGDGFLSSCPGLSICGVNNIVVDRVKTACDITCGSKPIVSDDRCCAPVTTTTTTVAAVAPLPPVVAAAAPLPPVILAPSMRAKEKEEGFAAEFPEGSAIISVFVLVGCLVLACFLGFTTTKICEQEDGCSSDSEEGSLTDRS